MPPRVDFFLKSAWVMNLFCASFVVVVGMSWIKSRTVRFDIVKRYVKVFVEPMHHSSTHGVLDVAIRYTARSEESRRATHSANQSSPPPSASMPPPRYQSVVDLASASAELPPSYHQAVTSAMANQTESVEIT